MVIVRVYAASGIIIKKKKKSHFLAETKKKITAINLSVAGSHTVVVTRNDRNTSEAPVRWAQPNRTYCRTIRPIRWIRKPFEYSTKRHMQSSLDRTLKTA